MKRHDGGWVHPTALIEDDVRIGDETRIWDGVHVRHGATIGRSCIVGEKSYVAYDVRIGDFVKINACVYVCAEVTIEDFVMLSAHVVFTNDLLPRAGNVGLTGLADSAPGEETLRTRVGRGATIGANATIGPGLDLGEFCMVGMGSVVTRDVAAFSLVIGNPARPVGWVCVCGHRLFQGAATEGAETCARCAREFLLGDGRVRLTAEPPGFA